MYSGGPPPHFLLLTDTDHCIYLFRRGCNNRLNRQFRGSRWSKWGPSRALVSGRCPTFCRYTGANSLLEIALWFCFALWFGWLPLGPVRGYWWSLDWSQRSSPPWATSNWRLVNWCLLAVFLLFQSSNLIGTARTRVRKCFGRIIHMGRWREVSEEETTATWDRGAGE